MFLNISLIVAALGTYLPRLQRIQIGRPSIRPQLSCRMGSLRYQSQYYFPGLHRHNYGGETVRGVSREKDGLACSEHARKAQ